MTTVPRPIAADVGGRPTDEQLDRIEHQFASLSDAFRNRLRQQASELDPALQPSGYRTLLELVIGGPVGAGELAHRLGFDKSMLSRQLQHLEQLGLARRDPDPADRRGVVVSASDDAVARIGAVRSRARDAFRRELGAWPSGDLDDLSRLLAGLAAVGGRGR